MVQSQYTRRSAFFGLYLGLNFTLKPGATRQKLLISPDLQSDKQHTGAIHKHFQKLAL
jgi:hypothetical protein